jgi:hypothetical protein
LQLDAGDDCPEQVLSGDAENNRDDARAEDETLELGFGMIAKAQDKQESDEKDEERQHVPQNVWNGCLPFLLEIKIPEIVINEGDDDSRAEENEGGADVIAPVGLNAVNGNGGVEGEGETENLEEESKGNAGASFEKAAEAEQHEIGEDKRGGRGNGALGIDERLNHRCLILTVNSLCNKQAGSHLSALSKKQAGVLSAIR